MRGASGEARDGEDCTSDAGREVVCCGEGLGSSRGGFASFGGGGGGGGELGGNGSGGRVLAVAASSSRVGSGEGALGAGGVHATSPTETGPARLKCGFCS